MEALLANLEAIRRKVKIFGVLFGVGIVVAAGVGLLLATVLADYVFNLPAFPRILLMLAAAAAAGFAAWRWVFRPMLARLSLGDIAGRLEHAFPQFDDRLRSTVNFASQDVPGSDLMKDRVVAQAAELARSLDLDRAIVLKPVWYSLAGGSGAIVLLVGLITLANPELIRIAASRLLSPLSATSWPKSVQIDLVGEVPQRMPVGQKLDVKIKLARGDRASRKAIIHYRYGDGPEQVELMQRGADGTYTAALDAKVGADESTGMLRAWIEAGDDRKELPAVTIVPRLVIRKVEAAITPPPYTQLPASVVNLSQSQAVVPLGSNIKVVAAFNKPLDASKPVTIEPLASETRTDWPWTSTNDSASGQIVATASLRFRIHATDLDGFQNSAIEEYELIVRPDQNPTVQIENPRRNEDRTAEATVPVQVLAEDDYGIGDLRLVVNRVGIAGATTVPADQQARPQHWEIPLFEKNAPAKPVSWNRVDGSTDRHRFRANFGWELSRLADADLKPGDVLEYFALVTDTYDLNGQKHSPVPSGRLRITIISQEDLANRVTEELRNAAEQINQIKQGQNRTTAETKGIAKDTRDKSDLDAADKTAIDRLANQQATAASQAKQVAAKLDNVLEKLDENKSPNQELRAIAREVSDQLNKTAEDPMKSAAAKLNEAKDGKQSASSRDQTFARAGEQQERSSDQLQKALDRMGNIGSLQQTIDAFRDLLAEQQKISKDTVEIGKTNLGKKPEQMSPADREKLAKAARDQANLAARTEKAVAEMQKVAQQLAKSDPASAEAMKQAAQTAQQQQVSTSQSKASSAAAQNQQSQAQSSQKQAELGLQMIIDNLREAERRKLEELSRKLADLQKQLANLIRRQAGHNLDNLALQGPDRLAKVDANEMAVLLDAAQRTKETLVGAAALPQLTAAQEQTERNTRDIAKSAEDMQGGADAGTHLTRAASRMERAIVLLREGKLPDAYQPPQMEALAELLETKKIIDEQKKKLDDKQKDQQRESIRQAYEKIRDDQDKLNKETARIDAAPRSAEGTLRREDAVRLGRLPGEQGAISDRTAKLEEDLSALGSIVYIWANKDIVASMNEVKDDLGKPATGAVTQAEQKRVIDQLDAMIRNLATKPPDEEFADRNSGGGGGQQGKPKPQLPSEVELKLLKDLQISINTSTKTINDQPEKDKPRLLSLGGRQGQLRDLLDQLLQKSSNGQTRLGPEPDNKDQLPEEATAEQVEDQELENELLSDAAEAEKIEKDVNRIGDRMGRSRQRLALNSDPGKTTQVIQDRILRDLDELIKSSRKQKQKPSTQPSDGQQGQPQQQPKPQDNQAQPQNQNANQQQQQQQQANSQNPAQQSELNPGSVSNADLTKDIKEKMSEWGGITPRQREAVIEGADETVIEKYKKLVDDYYRTLATKSTDR